MLQQKYKKIPNSFIYFDFSQFITENKHQNKESFILQNSGKYPFDIGLLADYLELLSKAKIKLPLLTASGCLFTNQSYEQASSEKLATFKAKLVSGTNLLDLSGGLGVDDWAFSKRFEHIVSLDINDQLNKLVRFNFEKLSIQNITRLDSDAYTYLNENKQPFDCVFLDADRRVSAKRTYSLVDSEPNILQIKQQLLGITDQLLLKVSPMLDLHALHKELPEINTIWVVSVKNEVKEILLLLTRERINPTIHAINIEQDKEQWFSKEWIEKTEYHPSFTDGLWFYEPSLSLIKANLASHYFYDQHISQLAPNTYFGISNQEVVSFMGRKFKLYHSFEFNKGTLKTYLSNNGIHKANISKRNFPMEVEEIKKLTKLKDGGDHYLFFALDSNQKKMVFHCMKT